MIYTKVLIGLVGKVMVGSSDLAYAKILCVKREGLEYERTLSQTPGNREYYYDSSGGVLRFQIVFTSSPVDVDRSRFYSERVYVRYKR